MLGGILGGGDEKPEVEAPEALAGAEAFASAVAAKLAGNDPGVARKTEEFLGDQSHLLKIQARHLEDEHALRVAHLRNQLREEKVRRFGLRLRIGFQLFLVLVATVIGIIGAVVIRDSITSRSVVIDPFDIAPNIAARSRAERSSPLGSSTSSAVCRIRLAVMCKSLTYPTPGRIKSSWKYQRPVFPLARFRVCSRSGSGMTCTSTGM
jgi:hypothetical protein